MSEAGPLGHVPRHTSVAPGAGEDRAGRARAGGWPGGVRAPMMFSAVMTHGVLSCL